MLKSSYSLEFLGISHAYPGSRAQAYSRSVRTKSFIVMPREAQAALTWA